MPLLWPTAALLPLYTDDGLRPLICLPASLKALRLG